ncbi:MAG: adenylate cyclase [Bacteroidia bacterium]|nr:adenylate cyclase [Bacteroidia bacterium]
MKVSKISIFIHFIRHRFSRYFRSNKISISREKIWNKMLLKSPFYRDKIIKKEHFPLMDKKLFMENFDTINTVGVKKEKALDIAFKSEELRDFSPTIHGISVGLSSGTSGNRGIFLTSKSEKAIWVGAILDRVIGFSIKRRKIALFLRANNNLYEAVQSKLLSFTFFDLKTSVDKNIDSLINLKATILVGQPSVLMEIAKAYKKLKAKVTFKKVISVAEVLEDDQKEFLESVFKCQIDQMYQCTEGFLGYTCRKGKLHLNEDWLKIEKKYIDSKKTRFHPVITDYLRSSQPIVRYELNDILHEGLPCECGSKSTVIKKIEGRSDDVFRFQQNGEEILIYPDFFRRAIISSSDQIVNYCVTLTHEKRISLYLDTLSTKSSRIFESVTSEITKMLLSFGVTDIDIIPNDLEQNQMSKFKRVRNEYSKTI